MCSYLSVCSPGCIAWCSFQRYSGKHSKSTNRVHVVMLRHAAAKIIQSQNQCMSRNVLIFLESTEWPDSKTIRYFSE
jgi:hypothetical protein